MVNIRSASLDTSLPTIARRAHPARRLFRAFVPAFQSETATQRAANEPTHALEPGLSKLALATLIRARLYEDRQWARDRRSVWSARSSLLRFLMFTLSVLAIVFLGIASLDGFAIVGFICTAAGTAVAALEGFFNWRARWVAADAALAAWHEIEESLALYVASQPEDALDVAILLEFDARRRSSWRELSQTWLSQRRSEASTHAEI